MTERGSSCCSRTGCCGSSESADSKGSKKYCSNKFDSFLKSTFYKLGYTVGTYPGQFIIIPIFITLLLGTGFQQVTYETDPEYLFSPSDGPARDERALIERYFTTNWDELLPDRLTRNTRFVRFIIIPKDEGSLLREDVWAELMEVDRLIHNISVTVEGKKYTFEDTCGRWDGKCIENSVLDVGELIPGINNRTYNLTYPFMLNPETFETYTFPYYFGGITTSNYSTILDAQAIQLLYFLKMGDTSHLNV